MATLNRTQLFEKVKEAIQNNGWKIDKHTDLDEQPVRFEISNNEDKRILRVYIWNLTHGGASRPENEYRIQVKADRFEEESNSKTLILGYWDEKNVFAGFDISKHIGKPGWSASMQIKKEVLEEANENDVAVYAKGNGEIAVAFRPDFFMNYVNDSFDIHTTGNLNKYLFKEEENNEDTENNIFDETEDEIINYRYSITSYGADYPVDALVKRIENDAIFVPPFQRKFVWNIKEASRFIESLILGLPVPGIFLSKEDETGRLLIVDGQQRLFSLYSFYKNNFKNKPFKLQNVQSDLEGKTYEDLLLADRNRLDDSIIHATVVKQEEPDDSESSIYMIFERLNSSGKVLTPQEIRASVYYGDFNEYLNKVVLEKEWRDIFGKMNERLKEQELLLRFFALYFALETYTKPLKSFLNTFMHSNRNLEKYNAVQLDKVIYPTITLISNMLGKTAFRIGSGPNAAVFDAVMVGLARRLEKGRIQMEKFKSAYSELISNPTFTTLAKDGTSDESAVQKRIEMATSKFSSIE